MASIELDIIKQRSDKLIPEEKRELIEYLTDGLADKDDRSPQNDRVIDFDDLADEDSSLS